MEVRMSLADAAALLNTAPNTIRSRFKAGKIRGERDNSGKIWVWINPKVQPSKSRTSKPSKTEFSNPSFEGVLGALQSQLDRANNELDELRPKALMADQIATERALLIDQINDLKADRDAWRLMAQRRGFWWHFRRR